MTDSRRNNAAGNFYTALKMLAFGTSILIGAFVGIAANDVVFALIATTVVYLVASRLLLSLARARTPVQTPARTSPRTTTDPRSRQFKRQQREPSQPAPGAMDEAPEEFAQPQNQHSEGRKSAAVAAAATTTTVAAKNAFESIASSKVLAQFKDKLADLRTRHEDSVAEQKATEAMTQKIDAMASDTPQPASEQDAKPRAGRRRNTNRLAADVWLDKMNALDNLVSTGEITDIEYEKQYDRIINAREKALMKATENEKRDNY